MSEDAANDRLSEAEIARIEAELDAEDVAERARAAYLFAIVVIVLGLIAFNLIAALAGLKYSSLVGRFLGWLFGAVPLSVFAYFFWRNPRIKLPNGVIREGQSVRLAAVALVLEWTIVVWGSWRAVGANDK